MQNIGEIIKIKIKEKGIPISEFARKINTNRNNVYNIFRRESIDTFLLIKISKVLECNLFDYFSNTIENNNFVAEKTIPYNKKEDVKNEVEVLLKEIEYLKQTIADKNTIIILLQKENELLKKDNNNI